MPTGGGNHETRSKLSVLLKEQCLALGSQLRAKFKINDYRVLPSGEIQFIHPKDGVPEK
jgi:photosystem I subunit 2